VPARFLRLDIVEFYFNFPVIC